MKTHWRHILVLCLLLAFLSACGTATPPAEEDSATTVPIGLYTVDTKPDRPMLYPVMVSASPTLNSGIPPNSFKLVNEHWQDVTGYINGRYTYIYTDANGDGQANDIYGIQILDYATEEIYTLGLDGSRIEAMDGLIWAESWYYKAALPKGLIFVTNKQALDEAEERMSYPSYGLFNTRTGKLVLPMIHRQIVPLEDTILAFNDGVMSVLDYQGNVLKTAGTDWLPADEGYYSGDDLLRVNETTYIRPDGTVALTLSNIHGYSNFSGAYAWGFLNEDSDNRELVFFDRQGKIARNCGDNYLSRVGEYYILHETGELLGVSDLKPAFQTAENEQIDLVAGDKYILRTEDGDLYRWKVVDSEGKILLEAGDYIEYTKGYFIVWDISNPALYGSDCNLLTDNMRTFDISGDGKYVYIDNGIHMGYMDPAGNWVYRLPAKYYNLED